MAFSKMPLNLADVITDEVRKLGEQAHTTKATQIFGFLRQQIFVSDFAEGDAILIPGIQRPV